MFSRDNPQGQWTKDAYRNVQLNYEKMRRIALREKYSAVWCIEDDMLPPPDALTKLLEIDAPVVAGLYVLRHGANVPNLMEYNSEHKNLGEAIAWDDLREHIAKGEPIIPISGGCQGCVILRRVVLEGFSFIREAHGAPDMDLMRWCFQTGLKQMARLDVKCGHIASDGTVLRVQDYL